MIIDLLSPPAVGEYNRKVARIFNLYTAVYLSELMEIMPHVIKKKTYDKDTGYFPIKREYVEEQTTLDLTTQLECDKVLTKVGILAEDPEDQNRVRVNLQVLIDLILSDDIAEINKVSKASKASKLDKSAASRRGKIATMQKHIIGIDTPAVVAALNNWIEAVYENKKYLTYPMIDLFIATINKYTSEPSAKIAIINVAMVQAYTNADWAIQLYARDNTTNKKLVSAQRTCMEVNTDMEF